jgi:hypothetical protein
MRLDRAHHQARQLLAQAVLAAPVRHDLAPLDECLELLLGLLTGGTEGRGDLHETQWLASLAQHTQYDRFRRWRGPPRSTHARFATAARGSAGTPVSLPSHFSFVDSPGGRQ